jgi:hypothetical protein
MPEGFWILDASLILPNYGSVNIRVAKGAWAHTKPRALCIKKGGLIQTTFSTHSV